MRQQAKKRDALKERPVSYLPVIALRGLIRACRLWLRSLGNCFCLVAMVTQ